MWTTSIVHSFPMVVDVVVFFIFLFFFQAEDGIRDLVRSRGLGDVYKRQRVHRVAQVGEHQVHAGVARGEGRGAHLRNAGQHLSLIHI